MNESPSVLNVSLDLVKVKPPASDTSPKTSAVPVPATSNNGPDSPSKSIVGPTALTAVPETLPPELKSSTWLEPLSLVRFRLALSDVMLNDIPVPTRLPLASLVNSAV